MASDLPHVELPFPFDPERVSTKPSVKTTPTGVSEQIRVFDEHGFRRRAGCIAVNGENQVMLIASSSGKWIVPAGGIDPGETAAVAAARETEEEAGVTGTLGALLGVYQGGDRKTRTEYFVLHVTTVLDTYEEGDKGRARKWHTPADAVAALGHKPAQLRALLDTLEVLGVDSSEFVVPPELKDAGPVWRPGDCK